MKNINSYRIYLLYALLIFIGCSKGDNADNGVNVNPQSDCYIKDYGIVTFNFSSSTEKHRITICNWTMNCYAGAWDNRVIDLDIGVVKDTLHLTSSIEWYIQVLKCGGGSNCYAYLLIDHVALRKCEERIFGAKDGL